MCLAIPMKIINIANGVAKCEATGVFRDVNLHLLEKNEINVGDFILVHLGYAIQKVNEPDARTCWDTYNAMQVAGDLTNDSRKPNNGG